MAAALQAEPRPQIPPGAGLTHAHITLRCRDGPSRLQSDADPACPHTEPPHRAHWTPTLSGGTMNARLTAAAITAGLLLAVTGCSNDSPDPKPAATTTTASASPTVDQATAIEQCTDAVAQLPADDDGSVPFEPAPTECAALDDDAYLDAYMDGVEQSNQKGRDALQDAIDDAADTE